MIEFEVPGVLGLEDGGGKRELRILIEESGVLEVKGDEDEGEEYTKPYTYLLYLV